MKNKLPIMGIDPGNEKTAIVIIDKGKIVFHELDLNKQISFILKNKELPKNVGIEMISSYGMPVGQSIFETCLWIGRFVEILVSCNIIPVLIYRKDVKMELCNSVRAKDGNIRQALIDRYGAPGTKKKPGITYGISKDKWAALGVAETLSKMINKK